MTNRVLQLAYLNGALAARQKLATVAGPIAYAPRHTREPEDYTANKRQDLWAEFDQDPSQTGEESSLGMPSAGGADKTASITALLAQQLKKVESKEKIKGLPKPKPVTTANALKKVADSGDTGYGYQGHGSYPQGGFDADQPRPDRFKRMSSAMREAFNANEDYDQSYSDESALTQPHGAKYAAGGMGLGGISSGLPSSSTSMMGITGAPKPPQAPRMPQAPKLPGMGKVPNVTDPRSDKPPGMNLQHSLQTQVSAADSQSGFGSPQRRMMGSSI